MNRKIDTTLYFITDSTGLEQEEVLTRVEAALTKKYHVPLIIDDRLDVAMAEDTEGVHLGQSDLPIATARRIWGGDKIVGATAKTVPQALEAYEQGADYLGVGAIYPTTTKVKTILTSTETLACCKVISKSPVLALSSNLLQSL